ncbi:Ubiquinol-cytochrome C chaperone family protein isoform 1 [Tripterygium wilfordii]|uniref:Ubiquinol-cytochrome C chaperone family protein isoform 1 n=1 Tax=Tripterygium wilfordii TaxID=458696 RepID=A0A7J7DBF0_TRIWF|nr:ubiquinol-cytochrome-c reductase complex assembly factor 1 [Tripterygium wilfordii]KAF5743614.1 Ubiquinol-cytochrome C chaperone family protein isoform 1 [Tripterygium wilfordii]
MLSRWNRAISHLSKLGSMNAAEYGKDVYSISRRSYAKVAAVASPTTAESANKTSPTKSLVNLDKMFRSKPCSLALAPDSLLRVEEPKYEGIRYLMLKMMLFYSKQSKALRGANVVYRRIISQVDKPAIYEVFNLEKTFKMTFSLLVLHMWLCLRRLKEEGKEGSEFGQYVYEIYNHDVELRVSKAGVNLLLIKWMKELEKIFYGNIVAYDAAMLPEAKPDELPNVIWRNVFSDDGASEQDEAASRAVQAMARYVRREVSCLSLTGKEAMFSGNFTFTSLENTSVPVRR